MSAYMLESMPELMPDKNAGKMSEYMPESMSDRISEYVYIQPINIYIYMYIIYNYIFGITRKKYLAFFGCRTPHVQRHMSHVHQL